MDRSRRFPRLFAPLAALSLVAVALSGAVQAGEVREEKFEKTYDGTGIDRLRLQNVNGSVRVGTWDKASIRVSAVKRAKGSRAEEALAETEIRVTKQGSVLDVETILPKPDRTWGIFNWGNRVGAEVAYELQLPATLAVDIETVNGRVSAERRLAPLTLNTVNGSVRVEAHDGPLQVNTVNGSVDVTFAGLLQGADLETVNGSVTVACSRDSSFRFDLQTVNGRVSAEGRTAPLTLNTVNGSVRVEAHAAPLNVNTVNGSVEVAFAGPLQAADLETVNGSVTVSCARDSSFRFDLQTVNGKIRSDFPEVTVEGKWGPKEARGTIAEGKGRLAVETVNGEVRIVAVEPAAR